MIYDQASSISTNLLAVSLSPQALQEWPTPALDTLEQDERKTFFCIHEKLQSNLMK